MPGPMQTGQVMALPKDQAHHLKRVLRMRAGQLVQVFDGEGAEFEATLMEDGDIRLGEAVSRSVESPLSVCLLQGVSRGQKMDYSLQKAVELGVTAVQPVFCERSVVRLHSQRLEKRMAHWMGVMESACEQSGRTCVPELIPAISLLESPAPKHGLGLYLNPNADRAMTDIAAPASLTLVIGPEGGLSRSECRHLAELGFQGVRLGPRVLRTETASVAALTAAQLLWGDLNT